MTTIRMPTASPWHDRFAVALAAVQDAAALLRAEYHRPGGPRGSEGHCPIDTEIEQMIGGRLRAAFPGDAIVGEEAFRDRPGDGPCWVIDPHDGTSRFQRGERGSAISTALMIAERPVIGIVLAPLYPDDDGDLITWVEGMPLLRQGAPCPAPAWPAAAAEQTVLISTSVGRQALHWAAAWAPARIRCLPSIAYRLALVAAGDAAGALTAHGVSAYDVAAGHALLLGAGGDLFDAAGRPLRYRADAHLPACAGGGAAFAARLAAVGIRPSAAAARTGAAAAARPAWLTPTRLVPGQTIADAGHLRRAQGCLLGLIAGDNLGALVEFASAASIARSYPHGPDQLHDGGTWNLIAGQPTDDGEQALCLARTLIAHGANPRRAAEAYAAWYRTAFDIGGTTAAALGPAATALERGGDVWQAATAHGRTESQANGALMRCAPLGIIGHSWPADRVIAAARADAAITHPHPICRDASAIHALGIAIAIAEGLPGVGIAERMRAAARDHRLHPRVVRALDDAAAGPLPPGDAPSGWAILALQNAVHRLTAADPVAALVATVRMGGDTDTTAAIAGGLLGAVHGRDAWPLAWRDRVLSCRPLADGASEHPRPEYLWPIDVLELAERLLITGVE